MTAPTLSICIPTYNRARFLESLLERLAEEIPRLPFAVEVIVSDNGSTDDTAAVVATCDEALPLRGFRHPRNMGAVPNMLFALRQAAGRFAVYLADDDILLTDGLIEAVRRLEDDPDAVALYAPWEQYDLVAGSSRGQFYSQPGEVTIGRGDYSALAEHITANTVFPEIAIVRADAFRRVAPLHSDLAYWAFTIPCEFLGAGNLIFARTPFYGSVIRHPVGGARQQAGIQEVQEGWDRYRGGLEHLLGLARQHGHLADPVRVRADIERIVMERMSVGLRVRLQLGGDPVESYMLAGRLRGLGRPDLIPVPMEQLRMAAAIHFVTRTLPSAYGAHRVLLFGTCEEEVMRVFRTTACVEVASADSASDVTDQDIALQLADGGAPPSPEIAARALAAMTESDLMAKFP